MLESALRPDGDFAAAARVSRFAAGEETEPPVLRRGSAESFRALAARLAKPAPKPAPEPPPVAAPPPAAEAPQPEPVEEFAWPDFAAKAEPIDEYRADTAPSGDPAPVLDAVEPIEDPYVEPVPEVILTDDEEVAAGQLAAPVIEAEAVPEMEQVAPPDPAFDTATPIDDPHVEPAPEPSTKAEMIELRLRQPKSVSDIATSLSAKFNGPVSILKQRKAEDDPFAVAMPQVPAPAGPESSAPIEIEEPDPQAGDVARSLLDIMSAPSSTSQPQERALAADTLLRLAPRIPLRALIAVVDRVCMMEAPPPLLVTRLIRDPRPEVAGPLLEKGSVISDQDLMSVIEEGDEVKQRMIARRRMVSTALADVMIARGEPSVLLTLVRNPGASLSHDAFYRLCEKARSQPVLQAPLATRADTPAPVAFELFWVLPAELRRLVLSRFLTDSENLNRILKIALSVGDAEAPGFAAEQASPAGIDSIVDLLAAGRMIEAARLAAGFGVACEANALRIFGDSEGEPMTVLLKVVGLTRARYGEVIEQLRDSPHAALREARNILDLQSIFDSLSYNKARVLLTYWDWAARRSGPYAALAA